jgi:hypothetical protein
MYFDDPTLEMISDYPAPKLPGVGSDAPRLLKEGKSASDKMLSASEIKTYRDMGYNVAPGMTQADVPGLEKSFDSIDTQSGYAQDVPSFAEWQNSSEAKEIIQMEEQSRMATLSPAKRKELLQGAYNDMATAQNIANEGKLKSKDVEQLRSIGLNEAQIYNAQGIFNGSIPPPTGHGANTKENLMIKAGLSALGYDLTKASQDWTAMQKRIQTLNSADRVKLEQSLMNLEGSTEQAVRLYDEWKATGLPKGFSSYNWAALQAAKRGLAGEKAAVAANTLISHVEDMANELSVVYKGGGTPTDKGLESAAKSLSSDWSEAVFMRNVQLIRENMQIRRNTMSQVGFIPDNIYSQESPQTQTQSSTPDTVQHNGYEWKLEGGEYKPIRKL